MRESYFSGAKSYYSVRGKDWTTSFNWVPTFSAPEEGLSYAINCF